MAIATQEQTVVDGVPKQHYIGGVWRDGTDGATIDVIDPATEEVLCAVADATPADAMAALDAAVEAQAAWRASTPNLRSEILWHAFEALNDQHAFLRLPVRGADGATVTPSPTPRSRTVVESQSSRSV